MGNKANEQHTNAPVPAVPRAPPSQVPTDDAAAGAILREPFVEPGVPLLAVSGRYYSVHFFRMDTHEKVGSIDTGSLGFDLVTCLLRNRPSLALAGFAKVMFLDVETHREVEQAALTIPSQHAVSVVVDLPSEGFGDGLLATASHSTVRVWNKGNKKRPIATFAEHSAPITAVCCVLSKKWLLSGSRDNSVRAWDMETQKGVEEGTVADDHADSVLSMIFGGDKRMLKYVFCPVFFTGCADGKVKLFSLTELRRCVGTCEAAGPCGSLLLHPTTHHQFFSGHGNNVCLWDIRHTDRWLALAEMHGGPVSQIVGLGGGRFGSCALDGTLKIWTDDLRLVDGPIVPQEKCANYGLACLVPFPPVLMASETRAASVIYDPDKPEDTPTAVSQTQGGWQYHGTDDAGEGEGESVRSTSEMPPGAAVSAASSTQGGWQYPGADDAAASEMPPSAAAVSATSSGPETEEPWRLNSAAFARSRQGKVLGTGSFGVVFAGVRSFVTPDDIVLQEPVAIKKINLLKVPLVLVEKEVIIMVQQKHPNVLKAHGYYHDDRFAYIVTDLCSNGSMTSYFESHHDVSIAVRLGILSQIANGMAYLHEKKVFHRDLKPDNILLTGDLVAKICDFGIAKHEGSISGLTRDIGTPRFMASDKFGTPTSKDIYAFGIMAYEVVSGKRAFDDLCSQISGIQLVLAIHARGTFPDVEKDVDASEEVKAAVKLCWAVSPQTQLPFSDLESIFEREAKKALLVKK